MSGQLVTKYVCDLCGNNAEVAGNTLPKDWVRIVVENRYVDRDFTDKHVCELCVFEIAKAAK